MKKILKDNRGSITTVVTVTVLFFSVILSTAYMITSTNRKTQLKSEAIAKETYEKPFDNLDKIREEVNGLPKTDETQPYFPGNDFKRVKGTNLSNGLVIEDSDGNQYVWVEVPKNKTVYPTAGLNIVNFTDAEYNKIENDLHTYTSVYRNGTTFTDTWVADNDNEGWFTESEYYAQKKRMLKSVYQNGGFYVGRYEAGIAVNRTTSSTEKNSAGKYIAPKEVPVSKADAYPYTYVTRTQAKVLAEKVNSGSYTSSLMFGVQWDLILAFMSRNSKITSTSLLTENSTTIGNYQNNLWNITNTKAKYSTDYGSSFTACPYKKTANADVLLTTGADISFLVQNIYDIAGNAWEWTLEQTSDNRGPCALRGGHYGNSGANRPTADHYSSITTDNNFFLGFRVSMW